ncbi:GTPase HflX [Oceanobacillus sp. 143]|uniref:GTPase HflX n=1 Tax=Oceanobacillus zhaokaii TaxID=2052660 RepID=A0A345PGM9_9BACI|nr:GTPase HflX [Oceanobacillus zhaokaii]AXI09159.1 GTPase HflX [Oceanobacillus zhaokaii]QGS68693.1 GTPase HflX [Oceanobacillus sp. 143]
MSEEKILIIAVKNEGEQHERFQSSLDELVSLGKTAGGTVKSVITQNRNRIHPATYIGEGKIEEIKNEIDALEIDLVISNDELSPGQLRNLGNRFEVRIIDRSQLILDIFAQRARTKEGKLQVELAQLEYLLPRLQGQGIAMSRLGAGIGTRGPGETKLETDRRHIKNKIYDIKRKLKLVVRTREQYRKRRKTNEVFQIAVVGYTNAGKSTLFNRLTASNTLEENKLFATLDPLTRKLQLDSGFQALITDTVGFLQELPTSLIASFRSTLEEVSAANLLLHIVDGSHEDQVQQQNTVLKLLEDLDAQQIPVLTIYNKKDLIKEDVIPMNHPYLIISANDEEDVKRVLHEIEELLKELWESYAVELDPDMGKILSKLERETIITDKKFDEARSKYVIRGYIRKEHPINYLIKTN